jgi:hypothetical protein
VAGSAPNAGATPTVISPEALRLLRNGVDPPDMRWSAELRHRYPGHASVMAYIGRHGWNSVVVDGTISDEELRELVDESYEAVVVKLPKRLRPFRAEFT